jgi:hypothetical protein
MATATQRDELSQVDRFKEAARDLECDEDEARWDTALKKVAKQKPKDDSDGD